MKNVGTEASLQLAVDRLNCVRREIAKIIVGQDDVVQGVLICLLARESARTNTVQDARI